MPQTIKQRKALNQWVVGKDVKKLKADPLTRTDCFFIGMLTTVNLQLAIFVVKTIFFGE